MTQMTAAMRGGGAIFDVFSTDFPPLPPGK